MKDIVLRGKKKKYNILSLVLALILLLSFVSCGDGKEDKDSSGKSDYTPEYAEGDIVDVSKAEYSYLEMEEDLRLLRERYPDILTLESAGKSLDGRELYYVLLGNKNAEESVMINGGIHGREYLTPLFVMKQLEFCLVNYGVKDEYGSSFGEMLSDTLLCVMPMINPDGITLSQEGLSAIRSEELRVGIYNIYMSDKANYESYNSYKNIGEYLKYWKANAAGVDLNRNFGIDYWQSMKTGIGAPSAQKYKGGSADSEPETKALAELTKSLKGLKFSVSIHSQGEIIYWDCGQEGELRDRTSSLVERVTAVNGYEPYNTFTNPDCTYNDWCILELGVPSVNIETGLGVCPLPLSEFDRIWQDNRLLFRELLR